MQQKQIPKIVQRGTLKPEGQHFTRTPIINTTVPLLGLRSHATYPTGREGKGDRTWVTQNNQVLWFCKIHNTELAHRTKMQKIHRHLSPQNKPSEDKGYSHPQTKGFHKSEGYGTGFYQSLWRESLASEMTRTVHFRLTLINVNTVMYTSPVLKESQAFSE